MRDLRTRTRREVSADLYTARRKVEALQKTAANTTKRETAALSDKLLPSAERAVERLELELANTPEDPVAKRWEGTPPDPWPQCIHKTMEANLPNEVDERDIPDFLKRA